MFRYCSIPSIDGCSRYKPKHKVFDKNKSFEYLINCIRCCLAYGKRIIQFIQNTVYIQIVIRGKNLCGAPFDGFHLVWLVQCYEIRRRWWSLINLEVFGQNDDHGLYCFRILHFRDIYFNNRLKTFWANLCHCGNSLFYLDRLHYRICSLNISWMYTVKQAMDTLLSFFIIDENNQTAKCGKAPLYVLTRCEKWQSFYYCYYMS